MSGRKIGCLIGAGVLGLIVLLALIIGLWVRSAYNGLVDRSTNIDAQWAQVETQYQRRFDLIPNLVNSVQGIFEQEREVFGRLADARANYNSARATASVDDDVQATTQVESALARLLVIVENYPELRSQQNVTQLIDELAGTENRIAVERGRFNDATREYNRTVLRFPGNLIANMFNYDERPYFEAAEGTEVPPVVEF
jgi:LemA protein